MKILSMRLRVKGIWLLLMSKKDLQKGFKWRKMAEESQPEVNQLLQQSRADLDSAAELKHLRPLSGVATSNFNGLGYSASYSTA